MCLNHLAYHYSKFTSTKCTRIVWMFLPCRPKENFVSFTIRWIISFFWSMHLITLIINNGSITFVFLQKWILKISKVKKKKNNFEQVKSKCYEM